MLENLYITGVPAERVERERISILQDNWLHKDNRFLRMRSSTMLEKAVEVALSSEQEEAEQPLPELAALPQQE